MKGGSGLSNSCPDQHVLKGRWFPVGDHEVLFPNSLVALDLQRWDQCLDISSLKFGLAVLYVVKNISGVFCMMTSLCWGQ